MTEEQITQALSGMDKLKHDSSGWQTLYRSRSDQTLWHLTYPSSERHGGGPGKLTQITSAEAEATYGPDLANAQD